VHVLKIVAEGITTSFRYPHFMQQVHPSYRLPPPSTIYGHICSALGERVDPAGVQFAYHFTHDGEATDVEHIILLKQAGGKLPGSQIPRAAEGAINPFERHLLFRARLVLYLNRPDWESAFRCPRYAVVLGRSQDLFTYTDVRVVELQRAGRAYFEHALLPYEMALQAMRGIPVSMPRYLDEERYPTWAYYLVLHDRVLLQSESGFWIDPTSPEVEGAHLGLAFLGFADEEG
jgi:CRISPR-associated protein Cas5t